MGYEVQQTRWDRTVRRVSGSIGPGSRVSETLTELMPVFDVERLPGELFLLGGTLLCAGGTDQTAGVGFFQNIGLFNPLGSGKLITITSVVISSDTVARIFTRADLGPFTALVDTARSLDTRVISPELPVGQIREEESGGLIPNAGVMLIGANAPHTLSDPNGIVVLRPNSGYGVGNGNTNNRLAVMFWWRERSAEESELSL